MANQLPNKFAVEIHEKLYLNSELSDVSFLFETNGEIENVPVHKLILAAASPVFKEMFFGSMKEQGDVLQRDATADAFKEFLQFFYLSKVTLSMENIEQVALLADKYNMLDCVNTCTTYLKGHLTSENMCWGYQLAILINNEHLKQFCEKEISFSALNVFQSEGFIRCDRHVLECILKMDRLFCEEADVFDACLSWAKFACEQTAVETSSEQLKDQLGDCFKLIRFGTMGAEKFSTRALLYKDMFTRDELAEIYFTTTLKFGTFQPEIFNGKSRSMSVKWNNNRALLCSRYKSQGNSYVIQNIESTWFSTNKPVLLGKIDYVTLYDLNAHAVISKPSTVYHRDKSNKNALHYCSGQRDLVAAASVAIAAPELLESADEDGFTPLHLAVIQGNMALVNLLLANKADVNALDNEGHSVVHWATVCGEVEALRAVLSAGADVSTPDINGGSPLHYAAQMCGAHYDGKSGIHSSRLALEILNIFLHHPHTVVDVIDKDGRQPLLWAASAGSARAVMALVKAGARIESADKDGLTALHCAASRGHTECIDTLISLCGAPTDLIDSNGCTALHYAVTLGHADATSVLLDLEADPNRQDRKGRTPAHCGCAKGQFETVRMLRERKANMWLRNAKGDLPIHEAASSGRRELVEWLLEQKPRQVNITSNDGRTILHIAAGNDFTDMCKMLLDFGADVNSIYRTSRNVVMTPLDCALQKGFRSTAKFLQLHGGLPASKLRLSGRKPNALNDQELVKPLSFTTNETKPEQQQQIDTKNSKHFVVYLKRSESDDQSCDEKVPKSHQSRCNHHRHRYRFRTSSCETFKQKDDSSSDMCRSKSNIEIHRRRKSRHRKGSSSFSEDSCSSSEGCSCHKYRKREKHKHKKREKTSSSRHVKSKKKSRSSNDDSESEDKRSKRKEKKAKKISTSNEDVAVKSKESRKESKPKENKSEDQRETESLKESEKVAPVQSKVNEKNVDQSTSGAQRRPQSAKISSAEKRSQEQNKRPAQDESSKIEANTTTKRESSVDRNGSNKCELSDESAKIASETIVTTADVHSSNLEDLKASSKEEVETSANATINESVKDKNIQNDVKSADLIKNADDELTDSTYTVDNKLKANTANSTADQPSTTKVESENIQDAKLSVQPNENTISTTNILSNEDQVLLPSDQTVLDGEVAGEILPTEDQSFEVLPNSTVDNDLRPSPEREEQRKSSFTVLASDESIDHGDPFSEIIVKQDRSKSFQILGSFDKPETATNEDEDDNDYSTDDDVDDENNIQDEYEMIERTIRSGTGRRKKLKKRVKSVNKQFSVDVPNQMLDEGQKQLSKDHDSGFEPSPRAMRTKIPSPRTIYTAVMPRKSVFANLDGRSCTSRMEGRKPGDKNSVNMATVTQSIQKNIKRYYMERKIFQHLLELKSLQIRSSKINESVLVKRAVDDYHKSTLALGLETGGSLRRYPYKDYTFKNFEIFLYETLKSLQKTGTYNFQNISDVYKEAERRLSPDYSRYEKALQCTSKTHRCLHSAQAYLSRPAHAYTGIPCAAYIPMMNHHTMPKYGFGPLKSAGLGSFYLPKISTKSGKGDKVSLELSHGNNKQLISLPSEKLDSNKRYYVTFTVKGNENNNNNNTTREQSNKG